jgi:tetratricopeptide (TPR) repeat protein
MYPCRIKSRKCAKILNINGLIIQTALNSLGLSLDFAGRYSEAKSTFERAVQIEASGAPLLNRARTLLKWKGDPAAAFADLQGVAADRLLVARSSSTAIMFYWTAGDHAKALELAERAGWSGTFGQWEYLFSDLLKARIREAMGEREQARRDYLAVLPQIERTRDAHLQSYRAYLPLAQVYAGLGRKDDALAAVRRSLALSPSSEDAHFAARSSLRVLVDIEARFGLMDEALEVVKQQIAAGWWRRNELLFLTDFIHLQKDPRFRALAEKAPL